ncbi:MAG TPA: chromate transporter [Roseococcus sp.]|nr:chromate transporter [Roseococcus sp.]
MSETRIPSRAELFLGYAKMGLLGFGGVAAWSRHIIVEEKRWLTEREYAEILGMGQILPGPNVGNASVMIGRRFHGLVGALLATCGLYAGPLTVLMGLALLYDNFADAPGVASFMHGIAAAAAGMVIATALKMGQNLRPPPELIAIGLVALVAAAFLRLPLLLIVFSLAPIGVWLSIRRAYREAPAK